MGGWLFPQTMGTFSPMTCASPTAAGTSYLCDDITGSEGQSLIKIITSAWLPEYLPMASMLLYVLGPLVI